MKDDIIQKCTYPSGNTYYKVKVDKYFIGCYEPVDGGFLPSHCRTPLSTHEEAIKRLLRKRIKEIEKEAKKLKSLL